MVANEWERLVSELKSLRQKRGLSLQALSNAPMVLAALNNPPPQEAYDQLCRLIDQLGDDERAKALRNAYAIGMREPRLLMARRSDFQEATGRDLKTIARYEDQMIAELASRLLGARRPEVSDSRVVVVGHLAGDHLDRISVTVAFPPDAEGDETHRSVTYENKSKHHSLPALLYQLPHDWEPRYLNVGVIVPEDQPTLRFWASPATELLDLMFASHGGPLAVVEGSASIQVEGPKPGVIYAIYWTS